MTNWKADPTVSEEIRLLFERITPREFVISPDMFDAGKLNTAALASAEVLGSGAFGVVKKCKWENDVVVAVKVLPRTNKQNVSLGIESMFTELSALERCKAVGVNGALRLFDYGIVGDQFLIVTELSR